MNALVSGGVGSAMLQIRGGHGAYFGSSLSNSFEESLYVISNPL